MNKLKGHRRRNLNPAAAFHRCEILHARLRFFQCVKRQRGIVARCLLFVVEGRIFFLQVAGIGQQNAAQVDGGRGCVDRSAKALLHQPGNPSAMVQVRMGQNCIIDGLWVDRQRLEVALFQFVGALEEAAVHQQLLASRFHKVFRSGDATCRA